MWPGLDSVPGRDTPDGQTDRIAVANTRSQQYLAVQLSRVKNQSVLPGQVGYHASRHVLFTTLLQQWRHTQQAQLTDQWQLAGTQRQPGHVTVAPPTSPWRHTRQPPIITAARCLPLMTFAYVTRRLPAIEANRKFITHNFQENILQTA